MIQALPGATVRFGFDGAPTGLTGTIRVRIMQGATTIVAATTAGIVEIVAGSGSYEATLVAPGTPGNYRVAFDQGSVSPATFATDDLVVATGGSVPDTVTLGPDIRLPVGSTVSLFIDNEQPASRNGTPVGSAIATTTVGSDGKFTFSGLVAGKPYQVYALVGATNVWTRFTG